MYSIGEISKLVKITSVTLRYYDEIQLLTPDYINPSNNYRFYSEEQVKELLYIMDLKDCGFNLEEITKIMKLNNETKIKQIFLKKKNELLNQSEKINSSIEKIKNKINFMEENEMKNKILIVDDAGFLRMMVMDILQKNGYEVIEAESRIDGVEKFKEHRPEITLMDIVMPNQVNGDNMEGIIAVEEIKKIDADAKIIMLSAATFSRYIAKSFIAGAVDFIAKPFQPDKLIDIVKKHLTEDVELDINAVKAWEKSLEKTRVQYESDLPRINEEKLSKQLLETFKECIDLPLNFDELTKGVVSTVKDFIDPNLKLHNVKFAQNAIDEQIKIFRK